VAVDEPQDLPGLVDAVEVLSLHGDILPSDQAFAHVLDLIRRGLRFAAVRRGGSPNVGVTAFSEVPRQQTVLTRLTQLLPYALGNGQPEVEAKKPAPEMGAEETGRASSATGYLLIEEMVGFVFASGEKGGEVLGMTSPPRRRIVRGSYPPDPVRALKGQEPGVKSSLNR
jgi:hypothetical protein